MKENQNAFRVGHISNFCLILYNAARELQFTMAILYTNNIKMKYFSYAFHPQFDNQPICNLELRKCHLYFGSPPPHYYVRLPSETFCQDSVSSSVLPSCFLPRKLSVHHVLSMATNYIKSNLSEVMYLILEYVGLYQIYF